LVSRAATVAGGLVHLIILFSNHRTIWAGKDPSDQI